MPKIIKDYVSSNPDPIEINIYDVVSVGEEYDGEEGWKDWVKCKQVKSGKSGWVPKQVLEINGNIGVGKGYYIARELTVEKGEEVEVLRKLNGWSWCKTINGSGGWLPDEVVGFG